MNSNQKALFWLVTAGSAVALYAVVRRARELDLRDRVVLIAGGSRGLGFLLAQEFARQGARVAISARTRMSFTRLRRNWKGQGLRSTRSAVTSGTGTRFAAWSMM